MGLLKSGMRRARPGVRRISRVVLSLVLVSSLRWPAGAEPVQPAWTNIGPEGGRVTALALDPRNPNTLYASTSGGGVFKTVDGGETWRAHNTGFQDGRITFSGLIVTALAIDPQTPTVLYAGTSPTGVFRSADGGRTWRATSFLRDVTRLVVDPSGMIGDVTALAIDPKTPATIYVGTAWTGVYKSTDAGESWRAANSGLRSRMNTLVVDPRTPTTLYAGVSFGGGVFKSIDGGGSWKAINAGLDSPRPLRPGDVYGPGVECCPLVIDPQSPTTLYVATDNGFFKSVDGGRTWRAVNASLTNVVTLAIDPRTPTTLYVTAGGIFKSTNGGETWRPLDLDKHPNLTVLVIDQRNPTTLYAAGAKDYADTIVGLFKSTDGGGTWRAINTGLASLYVGFVVVDSQGPPTLYCEWNGRLLKSTDGGQRWRIRDVGQTDFHLDVLAIDSQNPATLYAGNRTSGRGVFKSTDGGESWRASYTGPTYIGVTVLAIDPRTPTTIYAGVSAPGGPPLSSAFKSVAGILKSTDGGESWRHLEIGSGDLYLSALVIDPGQPTTLYAATLAVGPSYATSTDGVFKSVDGGETWQAVNTGLFRGFPKVFLTSLAIDPTNPSILYVGTREAGIFKSTDGGGAWRAINTGLVNLDVETLAVDPKTPTVIYAGTRGGGVFKSIDGGGSWRAINTGLANLNISSLVVDRNDPTIIYASTWGNGVFVLRQ